MSHSSGIGQDVHEATNGEDTSEMVTEACNGMATLSSAYQGQTCGDELTCLGEGACSTLVFSSHTMDSACRQKHTDSETHNNAHDGDEALTHTDKSLLNDSSPTLLITENITYMDIASTAHTHDLIGLESGVKMETDLSHDDDDVKVIEDYQADVSVQVRTCGQLLDANI